MTPATWSLLRKLKDTLHRKLPLRNFAVELNSERFAFDKDFVQKISKVYMHNQLAGNAASIEIDHAFHVS